MNNEDMGARIGIMKNWLTVFEEQLLRHPSLQYGFAILLVFAAHALRFGFNALTGVDLPYLTFWVATALVAAGVAGWGPVLLSMLINVFITGYLFPFTPAPPEEYILLRPKAIVRELVQLVLSIIVMWVIVTQRKYRMRAETDRRRLANILESISDGFNSFDRDGHCTYVNAAGAKMMRSTPEELLDKDIVELWPFVADSPFGVACRRAITESIPVQVEVFYPEPLNAWFEVRCYPSPEGLSLFFSNVTQHKQLESQLRHAHKLQAVGRLAGGVAHDFNNLLTVIIGYGYQLRDKLRQDNSLQDSIEGILHSAHRAVTLTGQLLAFSRHQSVQPRVIDVNQLITKMVAMLHRLLRENVILDIVLQPDLGKVKMDSGQMEQVIINLVVNASDAISEGGKISITTKNVEPGQRLGFGHPEIENYPFVLVAVSDTGVGMDEHVKDQIFEPFFTTKPKGEGTGLGLSTVYGIVHQNKGEILVQSELGRGSTFQVYLPQVQGEVESIAMIEDSASFRGHETILLVEDQIDIRNLVQIVLESQGYTVFSVSDGPEALEVFSAHGDEIDLLLTDVVMPKMSGTDLVAALSILKPKLKVIYMSGYAANELDLLRPGMAFLAKPFTPKSLSVKLREVLYNPQ